ncbi:MAG TPA: 7-cyano-7-deazaguanine synthase QueC [Candidatus Omnitrophica bacterium]|nr:MAG: 7-cyano-7-deazaguanine synthase QueC [Omnitrophica WOR_2 bacterium GWA2_45_18]OGX21280.1 MAG: 7-cyano-7-deazaguanine synthase QueC [Omnitrophica WOR_2 bacterium GWC2_45_7]HBR14239.1 7-cyano-7-deazaguanine synthase QueC [Candidatus Omnitrophota bacterium]
MKKAVVLLSGGLDSATILHYARHKGFAPFCLIFAYGQRHGREIKQAQEIARYTKCPYHLIKIAFPWKGSSLLDKRIHLPERQTIDPKEIPSTYVPARNIIFLSVAASYAEAIGAKAIFIGANAVDYSGYPDCRPEFFKAFEKSLAKGLKAGVEGRPIKIYTPLIHKTKAQIIKLGFKLHVPYHLTWSCYRGGKRPCGKCDSCVLRRRGFEAAGAVDPARPLMQK